MAAGVAAGVYHVEHMAAVTFTRKAASELRGRFHLALEGELAKLAATDPERTAARPIGPLESRALLRRNHSLLLCAPAARAAGRVRRVARLHRARRGAGSGPAPARVARLHHERSRRWRSGHDGADGRRRPAEGPRFGVRDDLRERRCGVSSGRSRVSRSGAGVEGARDSSGRNCRSTCRRQSIPARPARFRRPRDSSAGSCACRAIGSTARPSSPRCWSTWDCESKIVQKWWADSAAEKKRLRDLIQGLHQRLSRGCRRAVSRAVAAVCVSACR